MMCKMELYGVCVVGLCNRMKVIGKMVSGIVGRRRGWSVARRLCEELVEMMFRVFMDFNVMDEVWE